MPNILGIFAKQPIEGSVKTRLGKQIGMPAATDLYESFLRDLIGRVDHIGDARVIGFAPDTASSQNWFGQFPDYELWAQPDSSLGERIQSFFTHFGAADVRVILIGSDSPSIPASYLTDAFEQLESCDCVIGPASDGGYYLIGLSANAVSARLFENIDWSTSSVFLQTIERIEAAGLRHAVLPIWYDVDSEDSLRLLAGHVASARLAAVGSQIDADELPLTTNWLAEHGFFS